MASITLTGTLLDPTGEVAVGDQIRFTHRTTTGETIQFARSVLIIPPNGLYNFTLEFGLIFVEYLDVKDVNYKNLGVVTVNGDTTATDLPALLNSIVPPTDAQLLLFQAILQDTEDARDIALAAAAQQTTLELIFSTVIHPAGTVLTLSGYTASGEGGSAQWKLNGVVGQTVSQSPAQLGDALLNDANGNQWALVETIKSSPQPLGADDTAGVDNSAVFSALIKSSNGSIHHQKIEIESGITRTAEQFTVTESTDPTQSEDHRNFIMSGQGGFGSEPGTEIRGLQDDATKSVMRFDSVANLRILDIGVTSNELNIDSVLRIDAGDEPAISGHVGVIDGCFFRSFGGTPADAVVRVVNGKNRAFKNNWIGVTNPGDAAIKVGGLLADNGTKLQKGEENCFTFENNFVFGKVIAERMLNFAIDRNTFVDNNNSGVSSTAGGVMHCGRISGNFFPGTNGASFNGIGIEVPIDSGQVEDNGCINITENRFRHRDIAVSIASEKPVSVWNNFARAEPDNVFIEIKATARNVSIGPNDFSHFFAITGAVGINDLRHTFGTDQPTTNVDMDIVADFTLSADDSSISGVSTTLLIGSVSGVQLRGGKYRVRCNVPVRNSTAGKPLLYSWWLRYRDESNNLHYIGVNATGFAADVDHGVLNGHSFIERIVYLPATTLNNPATSGFELYVRNASSATINDGFVEGSTTELGGQEVAWFQVEEYRD